MNRIAQAEARRNLVVATIGGTLLAGNHRVSDNLVAAVDAIRAIADLGPRDRNLSSAAREALAVLAEDYPAAIAAEAEGVTEAVAAEAAAKVEDLDVLDAADARVALMDTLDVLESLLAQADCCLDASDGLAVYAVEDDAEDV